KQDLEHEKEKLRVAAIERDEIAGIQKNTEQTLQDLTSEREILHVAVVNATNRKEQLEKEINNLMEQHQTIQKEQLNLESTLPTITQLKQQISNFTIKGERLEAIEVDLRHQINALAEERTKLLNQVLSLSTENDSLSTQLSTNQE